MPPRRKPAQRPLIGLAEAKAMHETIKLVETHLAVIASATQNTGNFIKRWSLIIAALFALLYPAASKMIVQAAQNAGVLTQTP